jgi:hypothetical protein
VTSVTKYLAAIGKKGGEAGTGKAKKRSRKQYQEMAAKSAAARRKNMQQSRNSPATTRGKSKA